LSAIASSALAQFESFLVESIIIEVIQGERLSWICFASTNPITQILQLLKLQS